MTALLVRAAARGVIDFRTMRPREANWHRKVRMLLRQLRQDDETFLLTQILRVRAGYLGNGQLSDDDFRTQQREIRRLVEELSRRLYPWLDGGPGGRMSEIERMRQLYYQVIGDPNDPEVRRKWAEYARSRGIVDEPAANPAD